MRLAPLVVYSTSVGDDEWEFLSGSTGWTVPRYCMKQCHSMFAIESFIIFDKIDLNFMSVLTTPSNFIQGLVTPANPPPNNSKCIPLVRWQVETPQLSKVTLAFFIIFPNFSPVWKWHIGMSSFGSALPSLHINHVLIVDFVGRNEAQWCDSVQVKLLNWSAPMKANRWLKRPLICPSFEYQDRR